MIKLNSSENNRYSEISFIGIVIDQSEDDANQRHLGFLFRDAKNAEPRALHLAFQYRLQCDPPFGYWLDCHWLSDDEQLQMAKWVESLWITLGHKVPYHLNYSQTPNFSSDGELLGCGFTCATFVSALFEDFGFPIIDRASWSARENDAVFHQKIVDGLKHFQKKHADECSDEHIQEQVALIGVAPRFRPEEVAACANVERDHPVLFARAVTLSQELLRQMQGYREKPKEFIDKGKVKNPALDT